MAKPLMRVGPLTLLLLLMSVSAMATGNTLKKFLGAKMTKFDWQATDSAPVNYPMEIAGGSLGYHDDSGSLYVPNGSSIAHGWGIGRGSHIVGPDLKPLPKNLNITFFSYTENQFYQGRFDLPYDKILKLFQEGYDDPIDGGRETYNALVVGVAPGGAVAVWAQGALRTTEVFFGQAEKIAGNWDSIRGNALISREEYVRKRLTFWLSPVTPDGDRDVNSPQTQQALAALRKNGVPIGLWNTYRTHYRWQPLFTNMPVADGLIHDIKYFNGEQDYLYYPLEKGIAENTRPVPKELHFVWARPGRGLLIELYFNEAEILAAFQKLGANNQPLQLEMRLDTADGKAAFTVWLRNDKEAIELERTAIKHYNA